MEEIINGKYSLETWLGGGSFSDVWKASDIQVPGVVKAIKIYKPTAQTESLGREIMMGEYGIMANTNHPNLLRPDYFDYCRGGKYDGRPFLVLSFCERGNIKSLMGKFSESDAWHLLRDIASALDYLHSQNPPILHQDIKPENILIGSNGEYILTDFGVSVKVKPHQDFSDKSVVERAKLSAGTLTYMAPERFQKNQKPLLSNDVWALGATIYEMLAGFPPFELGGSNQRNGDEIQPLDNKYSETLRNTILETMVQDTSKRPQAKILVEKADKALDRLAKGLPVDEPEDETPNDVEHEEEQNKELRNDEEQRETSLQNNLKSTQIEESAVSDVDNNTTETDDGSSEFKKTMVDGGKTATYEPIPDPEPLPKPEPLPEPESRPISQSAPAWLYVVAAIVGLAIGGLVSFII